MCSISYLKLFTNFVRIVLKASNQKVSMTDTIQMTQNGDMLKRQKNATVMCEAVLKTKVAVTLTRQEKLRMPSSAK